MRVFTPGLRYCGFLTLFALAVPNASWAGAPARAPLDALWQEHMLTGSAATIYVDQSGQRTISIPRRPFNEQQGETYAESAATTTSGIQVARLDERWLVWRNGGWVLQGGLLARVGDHSSAIELYGKAVIRRPPYVPGGPFPRDPPMTTGYEFFLLLRKANAPRATILRQWTFQPSDVVEAGRVTARLQYDAATRKAVVTIAGLKSPVEETVEAPH